jgi:hypothetical protein
MLAFTPIQEQVIAHLSAGRSIKSAQEGEVLFDLQPGITTITEQTETECARTQYLTEREKSQPPSSAAPRSPRQSLRSDHRAESPDLPKSCTILHNPPSRPK